MAKKVPITPRPAPKTIKVRMYPSLAEQGLGEGGINSVIRNLYKHFHEVGVELVDSDDEADVIAVHAGMKIGVTGKPLVAMCHGIYWTGEGEAADWEFDGNSKVIESIREAHVVTVPSYWVATVLERDMHLTPHVVPHGVNIEDFATDEKGAYILWNKNRVTDACDPKWVKFLAERFPYQKFVSTYHPDSRPQWGRSDNLKPYPNVTVLGGIVPHDEMKEIVKQSAIYLSTTKETFGIGILEALAAGTPVLAFDTGSARDIIQHKKTGYLAKSPEDLVAGLEWLLERGDTMRAECIERARRYTWYGAVLKYRTAFDNAIREHNELQTGGCAIVIPCYNRADTLTRAIDSALAQTRPAARIIVVDNNSTDETKEIAASYADRGVEYTNAVLQGVGHARNHAIGMLNVPFVCCLDADDELDPDMLAVTVPELMADNRLGVAYTGIYAVMLDGREGVTEWPPMYNFNEFLIRRNQVPTCCVFRVDMWRSLGGYRQRYGPKGAGAEDAEFFLRCGARGWLARKVTDRGLFIYHMNVGITSMPDYSEVNWRYWHPWVYDGRHPFASLAQPEGRSHPVIFYDDPYVSIVVPCAKKHLDLLWDALDSVEGQTVRKWELIIAFDFDPEDTDTYLKAERLLDAFPFAEFTFSYGEGAGAARNKGALLATAPNLLFLDADDFLNPIALERLLSASYDNDAVAYSDYIGHAYIEDTLASQLARANRLISYDAKDKHAHIRYESFDYECEKAAAQPASGEEPYLWCLVSALVRKEWHDAIGGFDETMASWEDWDYWLRMAWNGICFTRVPEPLVDYRFYSGERRENGRQLASGLLEYMQEKKKGVAIMPCGGCGRRTAPPVQPLSLSSFSIGSGGEAMAGDGLMAVQLNDGNMGIHRFVGPNTKTDYGYRSHGDQFLIAPADYEARKDVLLVIEQPEAKKPAKEEAKPKAEEELAAKPLAEVEGISAAALKSLTDAGIVTVGDAVYAGRDALVALDKVGEKTVDLILSA